MMPYPARLLAALRQGSPLVLAVVLAACASAPVAKKSQAAAPKSESEALMAAQNALRDGDCRAAAENYLTAAMASTKAEIAGRASQLAVGCSQLTTARAAVARWRELDPYSGDATLTAALIALKRYDLAEAREALTAWRESGSAGSQDPLRFAELLVQETEATAVYRVFGEVLVGEDPSAEVLLAQARLASAAQNMRAAMDAAQRALVLNKGLTEAQTIVLRSMSVLGEHNAAIAGTRALIAETGGELPGEDAFLLADLLAAADRHDEAQRELQRLAAIDATRLSAQRRLVGMALQDGDFDTAESLLTPLVGERGTTAIAMLYLAQLAERRGDDARAVQNYRLLADSSLALAARNAAARLMIKHGDRKSALALLDDYAAQNPESAIEVGAARAQLLVQNGDVEAALASLAELQQKYPDHPDVFYQRATVLESGGRTREAVAEFEHALKLRPDDPQLSNALGFTLADHNQQLPRAEQLVRRAMEVSPDNPAIQDSVAWVLYRRGKTKDALPVLERAWRNSGDSEIGSHYGEVLWKSGDEGKARYVWQQALNRTPENKNLRATMKRLSGEEATGH
jgi:tetratricopeptide (TPR) repeat protein